MRRNVRWIALSLSLSALSGCRNASTIDKLPWGRRPSVDTTAAGQPLGAEWQRGLTPSCEAVYSKDWKPIQGPDEQRPASMPKPARGAAFADSLFGTCVVRVTDHVVDGLGKFSRNDYSRRQAFNADNSAMVVTSSDGSWHLYDPNARRYLGRMEGIGGDAEPQWSPTDPNRIFYFPGFGIGMQIKEYDTRTRKSRVVADLASRVKAIWPRANNAWTKSEGSPSRDARYWAFMVDDPDWKGLGMFTYDLSTDSIIASYDFATHRKGRPDHLSMSLTGEYMVVSWNDGPRAFTRDFKREVPLHEHGEHSDLALDANGDDVYVSIDYQGRGGPVFMTHLRSGKRTDLFATYIDRSATAIHFSGRAYHRPGWVLASTYAETKGHWKWLHGKIFAVELKEQPRIINIAHHHGSHNEYFTEPHASVNRDFTRIAFNSNWETGSKTDVDAYVIELPRAVLSGKEPEQHGLPTAEGR